MPRRSSASPARSSARATISAKKITYQYRRRRPRAADPAFRTDYNPRIAVTVDMIATGTDMKPLEVLIFMRDVQVGALFRADERARRAHHQRRRNLRQVTPDAEDKTRFVLIDAVGVTESLKHVAQPLERERKIGFDRLIDDIAAGRRDDDAISSLAARLAALDRKIDDKTRADIAKVAGGLDAKALAHKLLDAIDPDAIEREAVARRVSPEAATEALKEEACRPFDDPALRRLLKDVKRQTEIRIDKISTDAVISSGYDAARAQDTIERFRQFLAEHRDTLVALQILYARPHATRRLDRAAIEELRDAMRRPPWLLEPLDIWRAYKRLDDDRVKGNPARASVRHCDAGALRARRRRQRWSHCPRRSPAASIYGSAARSAPAAPTPKPSAPGSSRSATTSRSTSTSPPRI